ncbi:MAG: hypothetical protein OXE99_13485 [Cellvibrionales bacterium]|nr:hypothetical protein [Cellvibrionales bacterium]
MSSTQAPEKESTEMELDDESWVKPTFTKKETREYLAYIEQQIKGTENFTQNEKAIQVLHDKVMRSTNGINHDAAVKMMKLDDKKNRMLEEIFVGRGNQSFEEELARNDGSQTLIIDGKTYEKPDPNTIKTLKLQHPTLFQTASLDRLFNTHTAAKTAANGFAVNITGGKVVQKRVIRFYSKRNLIIGETLTDVYDKNDKLLDGAHIETRFDLNRQAKFSIYRSNMPKPVTSNYSEAAPKKVRVKEKPPTTTHQENKANTHQKNKANPHTHNRANTPSNKKNPYIHKMAFLYKHMYEEERKTSKI